ncbi:VIT family protein [Weissella muntiaci]|uniref:VIT family protein n=1 Tax=Weissella muntiaci TaxID=2508881 RepID=A0A6C2C2L3_9LACO|nr:VIT family protein [Weissella muntiaci]TYC48164.1 VIT family protein [Weissella muntiaci]
MPKQKKLNLSQRNNLVRAAVMGANDGILSISGIVIGVAAASSNSFTIFIAGFAGILAGTVSMAMGEYVSVHSQNDAQVRAESEQRYALENDYQTEYRFVRDKYINQGVSLELATLAANEMMAQDALGTTVRERHGFTLHHEVSAVGAAIASMISFPTGSLLPMLAITLLPANIKIPATGLAVAIALAITGYSAAKLSGANLYRATLRNVISGIFTMVVTFLIGSLIGR